MYVIFLYIPFVSDTHTIITFHCLVCNLFPGAFSHQCDASCVQRYLWSEYVNACSQAVLNITLTRICWHLASHVNTLDEMLFGNPAQNIPRTFCTAVPASHGVSTAECFGFSKGAKTSTVWLLRPSVFTVSLNTMPSNEKKHSILLEFPFIRRRRGHLVLF